MSSIAVENVQKLGYEAISHEAIRDAVAALDAARATADEAKKTHVQLEQELPNAQQQDAAADERLRAEGKPKLKGRPATQAGKRGSRTPSMSGGSASLPLIAPGASWRPRSTSMAPPGPQKLTLTCRP